VRRVPKTWWGILFTERVLLRLALYAFLFIGLAHLAAMRFLGIGSGMWRFRPPMGNPGVFEGNPIVAIILTVTNFVLGDIGDLAIIIVVLSLVGLAASSDRPSAVLVERPIAIAEVLPPAPEPEPAPEPPPKPERHPLDPDPTDPPYSPPWKRK
jgi:hypothetical protein